jgi:hypothetical protein
MLVCVYPSSSSLLFAHKNIFLLLYIHFIYPFLLSLSLKPNGKIKDGMWQQQQQQHSEIYITWMERERASELGI